MTLRVSTFVCKKIGQVPFEMYCHANGNTRNVMRLRARAIYSHANGITRNLLSHEWGRAQFTVTWMWSRNLHVNRVCTQFTVTRMGLRNLLSHKWSRAQFTVTWMWSCNLLSRERVCAQFTVKWMGLHNLLSSKWGRKKCAAIWMGSRIMTVTQMESCIIYCHTNGVARKLVTRILYCHANAVVCNLLSREWDTHNLLSREWEL
jgi:hypothetical protein